MFHFHRQMIVIYPNALSIQVNTRKRTPLVAKNDKNLENLINDENIDKYGINQIEGFYLYYWGSSELICVYLSSAAINHLGRGIMKQNCFSS